jgi:hypothetical protein
MRWLFVLLILLPFASAAQSQQGSQAEEWAWERIRAG